MLPRAEAWHACLVRALWAAAEHAQVACGKATGARCIGVEIDEERSNEAKAAIEANGLSDTCSIQTCNALDVDYSSATGVV